MNRTQRFGCSVGNFLALLCAAPPRPISASDEWLPIPPADLALKDNPASPGANAMILYLQSDIDSKGSSVDEYVRIKIFTQEGTKEGDVEISRFSRSRSIRPNSIEKVETDDPRRFSKEKITASERP